jgi:hypothetical protein
MTLWVILVDTKYEGVRYFDSVWMNREAAQRVADIHNRNLHDHYYVEEVEVYE